MDIDTLKNELRKKMLIQRNSFDVSKKKEYDKWICDALWDIVTDKDYKTVHCYLPMGKEINLNPLIEKLLATNRLVITPKTLRKRKLQNLVLKSLNEVEQGIFGTSHPANSTEYTGEFDLIIVPGLAFDKNNFRLGYGGGYYDGFLNQQPNAYKLGIFYPFQKVDQVPNETHDVRLNDVLINQTQSI